MSFNPLFGPPAAVGGLAQHWRPSGDMPIVSLADRCAGTLYATYAGMACAVDAESGAERWASGRVIGDAPELIDAVVDVSDTDAATLDALTAAVGGVHVQAGAQSAAPSPVIGARLASYSPGWGLLAVACRRVITLWDERMRGDAGPVARFSAPMAYEGGTGSVVAPSVDVDGGCVHLDDGSDGCWSGHLLHRLPGPDARIFLYDVRRLRRVPNGRARVAAEVGAGTPRAARQWMGPVAPLVASIACARRDRLIGAVFAVGAGGLVTSVGGNSKSSCSFRWATERLEGGGQRVTAEEEAEAEAEAELRAAKVKAKEEAAAKKKSRVVTKGGGYKAKKGGTARTG